MNDKWNVSPAFWLGAAASLIILTGIAFANLAPSGLQITPSAVATPVATPAQPAALSQTDGMVAGKLIIHLASVSASYIDSNEQRLYQAALAAKQSNAALADSKPVPPKPKRTVTLTYTNPSDLPLDLAACGVSCTHDELASFPAIYCGSLFSNPHSDDGHYWHLVNAIGDQESPNSLNFDVTGNGFYGPLLPFSPGQVKSRSFAVPADCKYVGTNVTWWAIAQ